MQLSGFKPLKKILFSRACNCK